MNAALRLAPSGPPIQNISGAPLKFGQGARLRLSEATSTSAGGNTIPTTPGVLGNPIAVDANQGGALALELLAPQPGLNYRATVICDVVNPTTNVTHQVELYFDTSPDGTVWTERASNSHVLAAATARQIRLDLPLTIGSALGVVANSAFLNVRVRIGASLGGTVALLSSPLTPGGDLKSVGSIDVQFEEDY